IGIQDTPRELADWRGPIQAELEELGKPDAMDGLELCSMYWFVITDEESDQTDQGKASNILIGTKQQITDNLKRLAEAGLTMPLIWPPFTDVPVSKTLEDLKVLNNEILPAVNAM
ncbi:MAG: LLM class flavin-dependent oxidoreductase, partial [Acidimicrobiia bacterium]|nr:LLM class flavin-dependent oxidoreductase [Acidimicrobiia bacterium]